MATRILRVNEDPILRKRSKEIKEITPKIETLAQDMIETLQLEEGAGLAGPQVGVLRRIIIVDMSYGEDEEEPSGIEWPIVAINPEILSQSGEIIKVEACLSFPGLAGKVARPETVTVAYTDLDGNRHEETFTEMAARCFCHEIDHLNGEVFIDKVIEGTLENDEDLEDDLEEADEADE